MTKNLLHIIFWASLILTGCNSAKSTVERVKPVNYIVLLDLSDRLMADGVIQADKIMINEVFKHFVSAVRQNITINSSDKFNFRILPQKNNAPALSGFENKLSIDMENIDIQYKNEKLEHLSLIIQPSLDSIYSIAYKGKNTNLYFGTDIWKYFNEQLSTDLSSNADNIVIVLTDGYFDFENDQHALRNGNRFTSSSFYSRLQSLNWKEISEKSDYGLIPIHFNTPFRCIVAGLNPKTSALNELDKLTYFWEKWMKESGETDLTVISKSSAEKMKKLLTEALNKKI